MWEKGGARDWGEEGRGVVLDCVWKRRGETTVWALRGVWVAPVAVIRTPVSALKV